MRNAESVVITPSIAGVLFSPWAMADIQQLARASQDGKETGGVLLGFDATDTTPLTVTAAGDPGPHAQRSASRFRRDLKHAQAIADAAWALDRSLWIGDWHTHPAGDPSPSTTDLAGYRAALRAGDLPSFLSVILSPGARSGWRRPETRCWLVSVDSVQEIEPVSP
ncbi:MAG TPA: Mov34/MPN/PAD-1 family protein [Solirubrobacteraceae bacterium]|nr:Mov34/MPN/PAD-1 family protein [Solirubrobacteraceae bacterium]